MLISYTHRFIFIHNYKAAGTSVRSALAPYALVRPASNRMLQQLLHRRPDAGMRLERWLTRSRLTPVLLRLGLQRFPRHNRAVALRERLPDRLWTEYFKFGFVRNPWDREVSTFGMRKRRGDFPAEYGFERYIGEYLPAHALPQSDLFCDAEGQVLVDCIGRFESLREDFRAIVDRVGIQAALPHLNRSEHPDYRTMYAPGMVDVVGRLYRQDIERFQYAFE